MSEINSGATVAGAAADGLDPFTFEIIRHRLWAINDEQGKMAARLSGSPIVYEARDFNAAITTADGRGLMTGVYILHQGAVIDTFVRRVLAEWDPEEIHEGDMFFSNDPASGALHANDGILAMPVFWDGRIVCWAGIVMHDNDVGGPIPGSFAFGARDRFGESPLIPGVKAAENYELRHDILALYLRNSRTPDSNALNMRARVAALRSTKGRIDELIERYGVEAFDQAQEQILTYVEKVLRERLREVPDGEWTAQTYHDSDTISDERFPLRCRLTKRGDDLSFDMTGTSPQAPGPINCQRIGMEVAIQGVIFTYLCHDLPWSTGSVRNIVDIVSERGSLNDAGPDAPMSMASLMAILSTQDLIADVFAKMLLSSERHREEAQGTWAPVGAGGQVIGKGKDGEQFFGHLMEGQGGGGGARTFADGVDTGGIFHSMAATLNNVETLEATTRILYLYRRQAIDGGGAGRFRGGTPVEFGLVTHGCAGPCLLQTLGSSYRVPGGRGLSGGSPGGAARILVVRGAEVGSRFAAGELPAREGELEGEVEALPSKARTMLGPGDALVGVTCGGAGYGDPLRRDPERVARDVRARLVSEQGAREVYGVVLRDGDVDLTETEKVRQATRAARLAAGARQEGEGDAAALDGPQVNHLHPVGDAVEAVTAGDDRRLRCTVCAHDLGPYREDYKAKTLFTEVQASRRSEYNRYCAEEYVMREYSCPGCGTLLAVDVQDVAEERLPECSFLG
ncbi:MAG: hydantoinase B/oxoprolinase family protein [Solirubrobacterales bacterium]